MRRNTFPGIRPAVVHALLVLLALLVLPSTATHYRYGTVSYKIISTDGQVEFRIQLAYRRSYTDSWLSGEIGDVVYSSGIFSTDDGTSEFNPQLIITAFSVDKDWVFLEGTYQHTYADTTRTYYPEFESCCRIDSLINNANANYISRTMVTFPSTRTNESPVSSGLPIVHVQQDSKGQFTIPVSDTDNDEISCVEADPINTLGRSQANAYPGWLTVDNAGVVRYDTTVGAAVGLYNYAVQFSDAHSNIHIDFIIEVTERENYCACAEAANTLCGSSDDCSACAGAAPCDVNLAPVFENPSPATGSTITIRQGQTLTATFRATDPNAIDVVTIIMGSAPAGMTLTENVVNGSTSTVQMSWLAPLTTDEGYATHITCVWAQDNHNMQSTQYCVNILVDPVTEVPQPPDPPHLLATTGQSLRVGWYAPNVTDVRALDGYYLYINGQRRSASASEAMFLIGSTMEHTEDYLKPGTGYTFSLVLCNTLGCSEPSTQAQILTISAPFNPPTVPQLVSRTVRSITVSRVACSAASVKCAFKQVLWDPIYIPAGRELVAYRLTVDGTDTYLTPAGTTTKLIDGFIPGSNHTFRVAACEPDQCGRESETAEFNTLDGFASLCEEPCPPSTVRESLTSHWSFDEGSGTIASNSIDGAPDVLLDATVEWRAGEHGKAINLNGANSAYANHSHGNSTLDMEGEYTVCLWRRLDAGMNPAASAALLTKGGSATTAAITPLHIVENFPNEVQMIIADGSTKLEGASVMIAPGYELDTWHHVCFVRDRGGYPSSNPCTTENVVYTGTALTASPLQMESAGACQDSCHSGAHGACVGFSWSKASSRRSATSYGCTLFSSLGEEIIEIGAVSGPPKCNATVIGYVDGTRQMSVLDPTADDVTNSDPLYMGKAVWADEQNLKGRLDEVLIYSTALTANQVLSVYEACLPASTAALECPQCPLDIREPWPLMENFQAGGVGPIECRECCTDKCDALCYAGGLNPGRCIGSSPLEAYYRCIGDGYLNEGCGESASANSGCYFSGTVRQCTGDCALPGVAESAYGKCDTWTGKCSYPIECSSGYESAGGICIDIDDCASGNYGEVFCASRNAYCTNSVGSYSCSCLSGYEGNATLGVCTDIDECTSGGSSPCSAQATCTDGLGSYTCSCPDGYTGDGLVDGTGCTDINECQLGLHTCDFAAECTNSPGDYSCSCRSGFTGNGHDGTLVSWGTNCTDIDECTTTDPDQRHTCDENAECDNEVGHYDCYCNSGFTGDGTASDPCVDIDECLLDSTNNCGANSGCTNLPGNYSCLCDAGFSGDPFSSCSRCTSEGTGKSVLFDGYDDMAVLSVESSLEVSGSSGLTAQVWFNRDGASTFSSTFDFDQIFGFSATGVQTAHDAAGGSVSFDPILTYSYNDTVMSHDCENDCGSTYRVNVADAGVGRANGLYLSSTPFFSYANNSFAYYVLEGQPNSAPGLVDMYVSTEQAHYGAWIIRVDGTELYVTEGSNICGPWSAISSGGSGGLDTPTVGCDYIETVAGYTQGHSLVLGLEGANVVAGISYYDTDDSSVLHRVAVRSEAAIVDGRWHRATVQFSSSSSELMLMLDTVTVATATFAAGSSALLQPSPTLILGGDSLSSGVFKGRVRDARFWSSAIDAYSISNTDCTSGSPLIQLQWEEATDLGDGCPIGDYCQDWLPVPTCNQNTAIQCGIVTQTSTTSSLGTLANATWTLTGAIAANDWPLMLHDGQTYWNKVEYHANKGPCSDSPSCSMALNHQMDVPTPLFQYMTGLQQEHVGTDCSGTELARVLLNNFECQRGLAGGSWVDAYGSAYTAYDTWNCGDAYVGAGTQERQQIVQTGSVQCSLPTSGPALSLGSEDGFLYVQR